jgi:hypothetical protein
MKSKKPAKPTLSSVNYTSQLALEGAQSAHTRIDAMHTQWGLNKNHWHEMTGTFWGRLRWLVFGK